MSDLLSSFDQPVGIIPGFTYGTAKTLSMTRSRRSIYGGNFDLSDDSGAKIMNVDTSVRKGKCGFSIRVPATMELNNPAYTDAQGTELLHSGTTMWTRETTVTLPDGKEVGWASPKGAFAYGLAMEFIDMTTGARRVLGAKGDWKRNAELVVDGEVVAAVTKDKVMKSERVIRVAANIDVALVFVAAVLFDQAASDTDANTAALVS